MCKQPERPQCQATIQDFNDGATRYNLVRVMVVPDVRRCNRKATSRVGHLCLCTQHMKLAKDGLIDESGEVEDRSVIRDVRKYPKKFPDGMHRWAKNIHPELL